MPIHLTKKQLQEFKKQLKAEKKELEEELKSIAEKSPSKKDDYEAKFEDYGSSEDDQAHETAAYTDRLALENQLELRLLKTKNALARIKAKTFGRCEACGINLSLKRIQADPLVSLCLECKKDKNKL